MAGTKISALTAGIVPVAGDPFPSVQGAASVKVTASQVRQYIGEGLSNASTATVSGGYAADTYLAGSAITIPVAGGWAVGTICRWVFDMTKTAAGVASIAVTIRLGTLGTISDTAQLGISFAAGTAVADTGIFDVTAVFRSVGAGSAAVLQGVFRCTHHLAATGLIATGASGIGIVVGTTSGFASTTQTVIGLSFNGGAAFSGTNTFVTADADKI